MTFQDLGQNSMTFQAWNPNYQIAWLSRFSRTGTNPARGGWRRNITGNTALYYLCQTYDLYLQLPAESVCYSSWFKCWSGIVSNDCVYHCHWSFSCEDYTKKRTHVDIKNIYADLQIINLELWYMIWVCHRHQGTLLNINIKINGGLRLRIMIWVRHHQQRKLLIIPINADLELRIMISIHHRQLRKLLIVPINADLELRIMISIHHRQHRKLLIVTINTDLELHFILLFQLIIASLESYSSYQ